MKKILLILTLLFFITGCSLTQREEEKLEAELTKIGMEVFKNDKWLKGNIKEGSYDISLKDFEEKLGKDISLFEEDYKCDKEKTKFSFIVLKQLKPDETNYKYKIELNCKK